ncbi:MAG: SsrA-binding protein SmpB [Verrucomicrobiota bacterium]
MSKKRGGESDIAVNRKARRDYHILDSLEAGIELRGTEVKSIRAGKVNLGDAFARVEKKGVFLHGMDIQPYENAGIEQHAAKRPRQLLLHKKEILRLAQAEQQKGQTLIALRAYWKNQFVKIEIGLGKGKNHGDKRQDLKAKTEKREADREAARFNR